MPDAGPDTYLAVDAKPLPMRVAEFRSQPASQEPPAKELLDAVGDVQLHGHPGRARQRQDDGAGAAGLGDGQRQPEPGRQRR